MVILNYMKYDLILENVNNIIQYTYFQMKKYTKLLYYQIYYYNYNNNYYYHAEPVYMTEDDVDLLIKQHKKCNNSMCNIC